MGTLTTRQRLALQERLCGHTSPQTAPVHGIGPSGVRERRRRALAALTAEQRAGYERALSRGRKHRIVPVQLSLARGGV